MNRLAAMPLIIFLSGCADLPPPASMAPVPADAFLDHLRALCGQSFAGRVTSSDPADADIAAQPLVMQVRKCTGNTLRIPFHVGSDRSRTWVLRRTATGLRLKHDHRHENGSSDALTMYGGDTAAPGSPLWQEFPADVESREMFLREGRAAAIENIWTIKLLPGQTFAYDLRRSQRNFRVEFDLTKAVPAPPAPWGDQDRLRNRP